jgi:ATP-binding cassette subfamily F protein 3
MAIATASNLGIHVGGRPLFADVSFKLESGDRMTLSGRNGAGKSTLLRILAGETQADSGVLSVGARVRVALHDQRPPRDTGSLLSDYVLGGRADMLEAEAELARLEAEMSTGRHDEELLTEYSTAQAKLEAGGGYRWRDDVLAVLRGLGFTDADAERPLSTFSGGELTRASLARVLASNPDLLLLDEPTNHLDIPSLEWLERRLVDMSAAIVLVAHDRWFLEAVGNSVLEIEAGRARYFSGPWHAWRKEQAAREIALGRAIERQQAEIERMERFVERFRYKATKARQAQSRLKQIDKVKSNAATRDPRDTRTLRFSFDEPERAGREVLKMRDGRITAGDRVLLSDAELFVERGEHVVLVGANGSGKTTLIETLAGRREPAAGVVTRGHKVKLGYLSQHSDNAAGDGTVIQAAQRETGLSGQKVRDLLGGFLFSGSDVEKRLADISGGEQQRLSLAMLVASGANVLILDEPTNHLDIESREALEDALREYKGAVLLVSHDRALLDAVGTRTLICEDGELRNHPAGWADYQRMRDEQEAASRVAAQAAKEPKRAKAGGRAAGKGPSNNRRRKLADLEQQIERAEAELRGLEDELADPSAWASPTSAERAGKRHEAAKRAIAALYEEWEKADA